MSGLLLWPKRIWLRRRVNTVVVEKVASLPFLVTPNVFNPAIFRTGRYLAEHISNHPVFDIVDSAQRPGALDIGTGCGVHAVFLANRGYVVDAVDISGEAARCAQINLILHELEDRVAVYRGDLFEPLAGRQYDIITCSLPKFRGEPGSKFEQSWRSPDVIDRFAAGLPDALKPDGLAVVLLTSHGDEQGMLDALEAAGLLVEIAERKHFGVEIMTIYHVRRVDAAR